jgi:hypothetical protein
MILAGVPRLLTFYAVPPFVTVNLAAIEFPNNNSFKAVIIFLITTYKCGSTLLTPGLARTPIFTVFMRDDLFWFLTLLRKFFLVPFRHMRLQYSD